MWCFSVLPAVWTQRLLTVLAFFVLAAAMLFTVLALQFSEIGTAETDVSSSQVSSQGQGWIFSDRLFLTPGTSGVLPHFWGFVLVWFKTGMSPEGLQALERMQVGLVFFTGTVVLVF